MSRSNCPEEQSKGFQVPTLQEVCLDRSKPYVIVGIPERVFEAMVQTQVELCQAIGCDHTEFFNDPEGDSNNHLFYKNISDLDDFDDEEAYFKNADSVIKDILEKVAACLSDEGLREAENSADDLFWRVLLKVPASLEYLLSKDDIDLHPETDRTGAHIALQWPNNMSSEYGTIRIKARNFTQLLGLVSRTSMRVKLAL